MTVSLISRHALRYFTGPRCAAASKNAASPRIITALLAMVSTVMVFGALETTIISLFAAFRHLSEQYLLLFVLARYFFPQYRHLFSIKMHSLHYLNGRYFGVPPFRDISVPYSNFVCVKKSGGRRWVASCGVVI
nr:MAG TPA: hypothetical protein [Caudoviricetes sp.]